MIKEYGNILFVSNLTDIVGVEIIEKGLGNIKHLDGVAQVRLSEKGVLLQEVIKNCLKYDYKKGT